MDFRVDPEFQEQLDWMNRFVREEVEPLDLLFPSSGAPYDMKNPKARALRQAVAGAGEGARPVGVSSAAGARRQRLRATASWR